MTKKQYKKELQRYRKLYKLQTNNFGRNLVLRKVELLKRENETAKTTGEMET